MTTSRKPPIKKIAKLLARHMTLGDKGRSLFDRSGKALDEALSFGVPIGEPIKLRDGRQVIVSDQFAQQNHAFSAKLFNRFRVAEYKEPKPKKENLEGRKAGTETEVTA